MILVKNNKLMKFVPKVARKYLVELDALSTSLTTELFLKNKRL
jgi:hypothetical protein